MQWKPHPGTSLVAYVGIWLAASPEGRRDRWDLADVDHLALPLFDVTLLTFVKLLVDVPLPGATYDTVPPPPLSTDPGVSLIAAEAAAKE